MGLSHRTCYSRIPTMALNLITSTYMRNFMGNTQTYTFLLIHRIRVNSQRMFQWTACHNRRRSQSTSETRESLWLLHTLIIVHMLSQERNFWRKCVILSLLWTDNPTMLLLLKYIFYSTLTFTSICAFYIVFLCVSVHFCRAFSQRFCRQLMRFRETPL